MCLNSNFIFQTPSLTSYKHDLHLTSQSMQIILCQILLTWEQRFPLMVCESQEFQLKLTIGQRHLLQKRHWWSRQMSQNWMLSRTGSFTFNFSISAKIHVWLSLAVTRLPLVFLKFWHRWYDLTCKRGSVGQSKGLSIPRWSVRFRLKPDNSNAHGLELHRPSNKGTKLLLKVIKAIIITTQ